MNRYFSLCLLLFLPLISIAEFKIEWQKSIPETGLSGVCVQGNLIFFTVNDIGDQKLGEKGGFMKSTNIKGKCYDTDGNFKWDIKLAGDKSLKLLDCWLDATAVTPAANDTYVYFLNALGDLVCCTHDGKEVWRNKYPTNAGITPSKLILYKDKLIVSLPNGETAGKYYLYGLQALSLSTGKIVWKSDKILNHACRYDLREIDGKLALLASVSELTHYKIGQGFQAHIISPEDGKCLKSVKTDQFMQHFRCTEYKGKYVTITKPGELKFTDFETGKITKSPSKQCDVFYQWSGSEYDAKTDADLANEVKHGNSKLPTKSSMNRFGNKLFYFCGGMNAIFSYDLDSGKRIWVEVPYQIIKDKKIWNYKDIVYTNGITNAAGEIVMSSKKSHGYVGYGWGHVNLAEPLQIDNKLYWLGGVGVIYIIDLSKDFSPDSIETVTIDPVGEAWTFGKMAYQDGRLFIRSQKSLYKVKIK